MEQIIKDTNKYLVVLKSWSYKSSLSRYNFMSGKNLKNSIVDLDTIEIYEIKSENIYPKLIK